ncbi:MAG: lysine--tRNA ligase [Anaerolineae bacterium]|nr:lysine--tRNA ligase [Anaerolineae bacterium]
MSEPLTEQEIVRRQKLERLRQKGIDPYPTRAHRTHTAAEAIVAFEQGELAEEQSVTLTGRLMAIRIMGKASFAHIEDGSGRIQFYIRRDIVGDKTYEFFRRDLDLGDFIEVTGPVFRTRTGEITVNVHQIRLLAKALRPLPDKWHGLKDVETRYRHRYVDLMVNPEVRQIFIRRAQIVRALRRFLDERGFLEVETPILQPIYGGAAARPFITHHNQLNQDLFLRISFELYLKRLLVGGYEKVYEIGRDFRNEGISFKHNPEFTQLEFYWAYADYEQVMHLTEEMISYVAQEVLGTTKLIYQGDEIDLTPPWHRITLREAIKERTGIDYVQYPTAETLAAVMREHGFQPQAKATWGKLVDHLLGNAVEPYLIQPTFILDYPRDISPLAKKKPDDPTHVERFEFFIGGMEMGNAFTELNDPLDQEQRFLEMRRLYAPEDEEAHPMDEDYLLAQRYGMPPNGGFGMGIDRLTMLLTDQSSIREVILFPHLRSKG